MARKNLLQGLMDQAKSDASGPPPAPGAEPHVRAPSYAKGAIGAVSQSIADLKSRSVVELDPHAIVEGGLRDRVEHDEVERYCQIVESPPWKLLPFWIRRSFLLRIPPKGQGRRIGIGGIQWRRACGDGNERSD